MNKYLITGGAGFIGSHLSDKLIEQGHQVVIIDNLVTGKKENLNPKARFYEIDIQNPKIFNIFKNEKPDIVFHYAAQIDLRKSVKNPLTDAKINILGSLNILENCRKHKTKKIIFASSGGTIYGETSVFPASENYLELPMSPYGIAKLTVEKYLNYYHDIFGLQFVSLRLANVYGPRQNSKSEAGVIAIFCDKILSGQQPVINGDGRQTRDFVFVEDVVEANILAIKHNKSEIFNVSTGRETDINTILKKIKELIKSNCKEIHGSAKAGESQRSSLDFSKIKKSFGWQPKYDLEKGLEKTINWFKNGKA
jgi:UDP-glucose 4-epimerase